MSFAVNFPLFSVIAALLCSAVSSLLPEKWAHRLTLMLCASVAAMAICTLYYVNQCGEAVTYTMGHFPHPWGNELRMGLLEPLVTAVFSVVMLFSIVGGQKQMMRDLRAEKRNLYYVMADLVQASLLVLVYTNDIFTGYVFIEICTIASCGLLMIRQLGRSTLASVRYMIFSLVGSGLFLLGVILLYNITGHLLMPDLKQAVAGLWATGAYKTPLVTAICLITVGLAIKSGLFPFHFWMPDTYGYSTPSSAAILSGLVSKGYIFLLLKLVFGVFGMQVFYASGVQNVLYVFGVLGMLVGSVSAMREKDVFRMIAYSSAAQIGYIYMGIGISAQLGVTAAVFHILTHALTKPALFLASAQLADTGGGKDFRALQGTAHANRIAGVGFTVGAFSMIGLPLTMGFISKYLFAISAFHANVKLIPTLIVLALSTILNAIYFTRTVVRLYSAPQTELLRTRAREQKSYTAAAVCFMAVNLALGVAAQPLVNLLERGIGYL